MKPILFSTPMVQAILEGRKTQTRRIVKPGEKFRFGDVGGKLWVRETWAKICAECDGEECTKCKYEYRADKPADHYAGDWPNIMDADEVPKGAKWKPSIFMPREACRIMLQITDIRTEQLHAINDYDALAEGIPISDTPPCLAYQTLYGLASWHANPLVWVITFKRIKS